MSPAVSGRLIITLTVTDAARSASWDVSVLEAKAVSHYRGPDGTLQIVLRDHSTGLELCLASRKAGGDVFDEQRVGLDHLEFVVDSRVELDRWASHLDDLRKSHSGVKEPTYSPAAMVTFAIRTTSNWSSTGLVRPSRAGRRLRGNPATF